MTVPTPIRAGLPVLVLSTALAVRPAAARAQGNAAAAVDTAAVSAVLDDFHDAAADSDFERYFGHFAPGAVFLGTDASERWTVHEFRDFARPHFEAGRGWTYVPTERHVDISADGRVAWFDELLQNESLGVTRGSGVLVRRDGAWKITQYDLALPVPNEIVDRVVEMIRESGGG